MLNLSSVQSLSLSNSLRLPWTATCRLLCPPLVCSNSCPLSQWAINYLILCRPLLFSPTIFPSIKIFFNESALCIRWPKYCNLSFSISPSNEYSGLISFRIYWFDLLLVQWTPKSLLQHHNLKASVLWCSAFFMIHLSPLYMTTGKTRALTIWTNMNQNKK